MALFSWCTILLLFASNAFSLPNILILDQPNSVSLEQGPNSNASAAAAASIFFNTSASQANAASEYRVPNTPTTLRFELKRYPIEREEFVRTILQTQIKLRRYLASHYQAADDVLFPSDDPYMSDPYYTGCFFAITHWPPTQIKRLTYGMVDNVLKGIWEFIYRGGRFVCADIFVEDDGMGTVGYARLLLSGPGQSSREITEE